MTLNSKRKKPLSSPIDTKLLVAASEINADMLYATKFFAPDSFIYFERYPMIDKQLYLNLLKK